MGTNQLCSSFPKGWSKKFLAVAKIAPFFPQSYSVSLLKYTPVINKENWLSKRGPKRQSHQQPSTTSSLSPHTEKHFWFKPILVFSPPLVVCRGMPRAVGAASGPSAAALHRGPRPAWPPHEDLSETPQPIIPSLPPTCLGWGRQLYTLGFFGL